MTSRALLLACCCELGSLVCAAHADPVGPSQPSLWSETTLSKVVSAKSVLGILQRPTSVTLFRIQRKEVASGGQTKEEETLADPVVLSQEQAASLSKALLARGSLGWPPAKECMAMERNALFESGVCLLPGSSVSTDF